MQAEGGSAQHAENVWFKQSQKMGDAAQPTFFKDTVREAHSICGNPEDDIQ